MIKTKEKKKKPVQYRGEDRNLIKNYTLEMQIARRGPKIYYSEDGGLKEIR
ncbi:MAG TPA: hypothetical protein VHO46_16270 [Bacteroidales bacterium]|nr:hypothetical protein [Bacteroidales bacterium]